MHIGYGVDSEGHTISRHKCDVCGKAFTVYPAIVVGEEEGWENCLESTCLSYDASRDTWLQFPDGMTMQ